MFHRRARYIRLPTSASYSTASPGPTQKLGSPRFPFSQRSVKSEASLDDRSKADPHRPILFPTSSRPLGARPSTARLLSNKPRSSASASRPKYPNCPSREPSPTRTQSSITPGRETTHVDSRLPARRRSRERERSPARSRLSFEPAGTKDKEGSPRRKSPFRPTSSAGDDLSRTKLWLELREVQKKV